jgi:hypothetical protein
MADTAEARLDAEDRIKDYTEETYSVWVLTPQGGFYQHADPRILSAATLWAASWNKTAPSDLKGSTFHVVKTTVNHTIV